MLQDTELWSVLEVSRYTEAILSNDPATWQKTFMSWRVGLLGCTILLLTIATSTPD